MKRLTVIEKKAEVERYEAWLKQKADYRDLYFNKSGKKDPTAYKAVSNVMRSEHKTVM